MSDNLTVQGFNSLFTYTMCEVLQDARDASSTPLFLFLGLSFVLNIFFLKTQFDNRKMIQCLQTISRLLSKEVGNLKEDMITLTNNFQSAEILLNMV